MTIISEGETGIILYPSLKAKGGNMNKKKEIDKLVRLTILNNFISSKLKEQKTLVKSFVTSEDKVLKGIEHKMNVIPREYKKFDSARFKVEQPLMYSQYKTMTVESIELKPIVDQDQESELLTENFPLLQMQTQ
jgi:hypothetical protein